MLLLRATIMEKYSNAYLDRHWRANESTWSRGDKILHREDLWKINWDSVAFFPWGIFWLWPPGNWKSGLCLGRTVGTQRWNRVWSRRRWKKSWEMTKRGKRIEFNEKERISVEQSQACLPLKICWKVEVRGVWRLKTSLWKGREFSSLIKLGGGLESTTFHVKRSW